MNRVGVELKLEVLFLFRKFNDAAESSGASIVAENGHLCGTELIDKCCARFGIGKISGPAKYLNTVGGGDLGCEFIEYIGAAGYQNHVMSTFSEVPGK